jgi:cob(I)alamin adenosyltransferase
MPDKIMPRQPRITEAEISALEAEIDRCTAALPPLRSFVLPGGSRLNAELHVCRTVCRRAERLAVAMAREGGVDQIGVRYLNRLSDALFVYSRWANHVLGVPEVLWQPNRAASAK